MTHGYVATPLQTWKEQAATGAGTDAMLCKAGVSEVEAEKDSRRVTFTISTASVDRDRDIISVDGWELANFKKSGVVLWAHDYRNLPVARSLKVWKEDDKLKSTAEFATAETYPFADTVYRMVKGGFLRATSVGFRPLKWNFNEERSGVDFLSQELLEWSVVPVPANPQALVEASASGIDTEPLKQWAEQILDGAEGPGVWVPKSALVSAYRFTTGNKIFFTVSSGNGNSIEFPAASDLKSFSAPPVGPAAETPTKSAEPLVVCPKAPDDIDILHLDDEDEDELNEKDVMAALKELVGEHVQAGVQRAMTALTGRLD
jgi:HK97 family phage prohead protease